MVMSLSTSVVVERQKPLLNLLGLVVAPSAFGKYGPAPAICCLRAANEPAGHFQDNARHDSQCTALGVRLLGADR
jgi:hypothetical protein